MNVCKALCYKSSYQVTSGPENDKEINVYLNKPSQNSVRRLQYSPDTLTLAILHPRLIHMIVQDTTMLHWQPMLNCPLNLLAIFAQSCLICTLSCYFCMFLVFFSGLTNRKQRCPIKASALCLLKNCLFCFKCDSCETLYMYFEINWKVDFDAINLWNFWSGCLFISFVVFHIY